MSPGGLLLNHVPNPQTTGTGPPGAPGMMLLMDGTLDWSLEVGSGGFSSETFANVRW